MNGSNVKFSSETIPAGGSRPELHLVTTGPQPTILFVHGANSTTAVWRGVMTALADLGIAAAAFDLRGHGLSGGQANLQSFGIEDYVSDVIAVLDHVGTAEFLVGHSMGGLVAQLAAGRKQLKGLVLVASSPVGGMMRDGTRMFMRHPLTFLRSMRRKSFARLYREAKTCRSLLFSPHTPDEVIRGFMDAVQEESWRAGNEMNSVMPQPDKVTCPVMVIGGEDDFMVSAASVRRTAAAYGTEPVFMPRSGHMVQLESDPRELARMLADFTREQ